MSAATTEMATAHVRERRPVIQCPRCYQQNNANATACAYCNYPLPHAQAPFGAGFGAGANAADWTQAPSANAYPSSQWGVDPSAYGSPAMPGAAYPGAPATPNAAYAGGAYGTSATPQAPQGAPYPVQGAQYPAPPPYQTSAYAGYTPQAPQSAAQAQSPTAGTPMGASPYVQASPYGQPAQPPQAAQYAQSNTYGTYGQYPQGDPSGYAAPPAQPTFGQAPSAPAGYAQAPYGQSQQSQHAQPYAAQAGQLSAASAYAPASSTHPTDQGGYSPPTAFPSIEQAGRFSGVNATGLPANSLLDASGLPAWMGGQASMGAEAPASTNGGGLSASALIDEQSLPQWLRGSVQENDAAGATSGSAGTAPAYGASAQSPWAAPSVPAARAIGGQPQAPAPVAGLGAASYPGFGAQSGSAGQQPPSVQDGASPVFGAHQLVDDSALPAWLRGSAGTPGPAPQAPGMVSAADLIDPAALGGIKGTQGNWGAEQYPGGQNAQGAAYGSYELGAPGASPAAYGSSTGWVQQPAAPTWSAPMVSAQDGAASPEQPAWLSAALAGGQVEGSHGAGPEAATAQPPAAPGNPQRGPWSAQPGRQGLRDEELPAWLRTTAQPQQGYGQPAQQGQYQQGQYGEYGQAAPSAQGGYLSPYANGSASQQGGWQQGGYPQQPTGMAYDGYPGHYPSSSSSAYDGQDAYPGGYAQGGYPPEGYGDESWDQGYDDQDQGRKKGRKFGLFRR